MVMLHDVARFRDEDPDALVRAALACPVCLHGREVAWRPSLALWEESASCRCGHCGTRWRLELERGQALRLLLLRDPV